MVRRLGKKTILKAPPKKGGRRMKKIKKLRRLGRMRKMKRIK